MLDNLYMYISFASIAYVLYSLLMQSLNFRYKRALNSILGKEIARSLYKKLDHNFTYDNKYRPDDCQSQLIFNSAMEEFARISKQKKENMQ